MKLSMLIRGVLPAVLLAACFALPQSSRAAERAYVCDPATPSNCAKPDASGNLPISGTFTATLSGFTPGGTTANLSVTGTSADVALPAGTVVKVVNWGAADVHFRVTVGAGTAVTTDEVLKSGAATGITVGSNTHLSAITDTGTSSLSLAGGTGLVSGYGGGGSGGGGGAVTNAGTFAVQLTGATNNINNIAGTVSLPTGASTAANQTTGNSSLATIATNTTGAATGTNVTETHGTIAAGTAATKAEAVGGIYNSSPITLTNGQGSAVQLDANGYVNVDIKTGSSSGAVAQGSTTSGQTVVPMGCRTLTSAPTDTTAQTNMPSCDTAGALRVNVTSATGVAQASTSSGQTISPIGCRTLTSAPTDTTAQTNMPWCTTKGSLVAAQPTAADLNATVVGTGTFAVQAAPTASTAGGVTKATVTAANSTNATNLKASAGALYHVSAYNNSATLAWVSFYNTAGTPSCGTSIVWQTMIPANSTSGAGAVEDFAVPLDFSTGIGYCITTGIAGTGSVAASAYVVNLGYK
jgi:hypothetical protein